MSMLLLSVLSACNLISDSFGAQEAIEVSPISVSEGRQREQNDRSDVTPDSTRLPAPVALIQRTETSLSPTSRPVFLTSTPIAVTASTIPSTATSIPSSATPVPPTATPVPPTMTRVPPTWTPIPPTATKIPPTTAAFVISRFSTPRTRYTHGTVNLRQGPGTSYDVLGSVGANSALQIIGQSGDWNLIRHNGREMFIAGWLTYTAQLQQPSQPRAPSGSASSGSPPQTGFSCSPSKNCGDMSSCAEARFHLTTCGRGGLDRDSDGIPCESICSGAPVQQPAAQQPAAQQPAASTTSSSTTSSPTTARLLMQSEQKLRRHVVVR